MSRKTDVNPLAGLVSRKGQAAPTQPQAVAAAHQAPSAPPAAAAPAPQAGSTKALTVKLDAARYRALRLRAVETNLSHQDLLVAALDAYLATPVPREA